MKKSVFFMVLMALVVRLMGIHYGLFQSLEFCPDTAPFIKSAEALSAGYFWPQTWQWFYSPVWIYLLSAVFFVYRIFLKICGLISPALFNFLLTTENLNLAWYLLSRTTAAVLGTAIIYVTYLAGRILYGGRAALLAAFLLTTNFIFVYWSHVGTNDIPMNFFLVLTLWLAALILKKGQLGYYLAAGVAAALTVATKVNGLPVILVIILAHLGRLAGEKNQAHRRRTWLFLLAGLGIIPVIYLALCHYLMVEPLEILKIFQNVYLKQVTRNVEAAGDWYYLGSGLAEYFFIFLLNNGWFLSFFYLGSYIFMVFRISRDRWRSLLLVVFPAVYFGIISNGQFIWDKHLMPVFPFLAVASGVVLVHLEVWLRKKWPGLKFRGRLAVMGSIIFLLTGPGFFQTGRFLRVLFQTDTRIQASRWLAKNVPEKSEIFMALPLKYDPRIFQKFNICLIDENADWFGFNKKNFWVVKRWPALNRTANLIKIFTGPEYRFINPPIFIYKVK